MRKFQVLTDSTSDVEKRDRDQYGLDYVKMVFTLAGTEYDADLDWVKITPQEYFGAMRKGNRSITGLVKTEEFEKKFEEYISKGMDILYVSCSSKLSGSINNGKLVAEEILAKYPERKIVCLDSLRSNYAEAMIAIEACKLADEEKTIDEAAAILEDEKLCYQTYATVGSLEWLKKAGRIKASKAFFGNLFGVKPIILGDAIGNNYAFKKEKGRKPSLDALVAEVAARIKNPETAVVYVEHADSLKDAEYVAKAIEDKVHPMKVNVSNLGPIIGATTGPDTITVNFYGEKVTIVGEE